ncbi:MAG: hypothetical protein ACON42_08050 [Flavobacteriaceae bacterium]
MYLPTLFSTLFVTASLGFHWLVSTPQQPLPISPAPTAVAAQSYVFKNHKSKTIDEDEFWKLLSVGKWDVAPQFDDSGNVAALQLRKYVPMMGGEEMTMSSSGPIQGSGANVGSFSGGMPVAGGGNSFSSGGSFDGDSPLKAVPIATPASSKSKRIKIKKSKGSVGKEIPIHGSQVFILDPKSASAMKSNRSTGEEFNASEVQSNVLTRVEFLQLMYDGNHIAQPTFDTDGNYLYLQMMSNY